MLKTVPVPNVKPKENNGDITYLTGCNSSEIVTYFE
jgi:hypothetical protein